MANRYVAFLRAVNVGGHARVTMEALSRAFARRGYERAGVPGTSRNWTTVSGILELD